MSANYLTKLISIFTLVILLFLSTGCQSDNTVRARVGAFFGAPWEMMMFPEPDKLGTHSRGFSFGEKVGMLYSCHGGFIDLGHVREAADRTAYLSEIVYDNLIEENKEFNFRVLEPSRYWMTVKYPNYWQGLMPAEKQKIAKKASIKFGQYIAHRSMIWHEIITWYGFSSTGIFSENISSFSWEDAYSDNLGTWLAVEALEQEGDDFDKTMTRLLNEALLKLDVQPASTAREAAKKVAGDWYTGSMYFFVSMEFRSFDVGYYNGKITPALVPGICPDAAAKALPVPSLESVNELGFEITLEIEPLVMEKSQIDRSINIERKNRLVPDIHFPLIIEHIKKTFEDSAAMLYGYNYSDDKDDF